jgi:hypothetical protein
MISRLLEGMPAFIYYNYIKNLYSCHFSETETNQVQAMVWVLLEGKGEIKEVLSVPVDFVFAQNAEKKFRISRV